MEVLYKYDAKYPALKEELTERINKGEHPCKVALYASKQILLAIVTGKKYLDDEDASDFSFFLYSITKIKLSPKFDIKGELEDFFDLMLLYYLFIEHLDYMQDFPDTVCWVPGLTRGQRRIMLTWPRTFILSLFEVTQQDEHFVYKDLNTRKLHIIDAAASDIHLSIDENKKDTVLALIVPIGETYLSTQPIYYQMDDVALADAKWIDLYEESGYEASYDYCDDLLRSYYEDFKISKRCEENQQLTRNLSKDPDFYPANRILKETDPAMAQRLLRQHEFFRKFEHLEQAEKLLAKVISTLPQLFHPYANAYDLIEALRLLFVGEVFTADELRDSSAEAPIFWYSLICQSLPEEVKALKSYIIPE